MSDLGEEHSASFALEFLAPTPCSVLDGEHNKEDSSVEEEEGKVCGASSSDSKNSSSLWHRATNDEGSVLQRLGYLVLRGPPQIEGTPYVHIYSLSEWQDGDFWRALVAGTPLQCTPPPPPPSEEGEVLWLLVACC
jgi:hypothetical protein